MSMYTEYVLVEQPAIDLFERQLDYKTINAYYEKFGPQGTLGRQDASEVVLIPRLRTALKHINQKYFSPETLDQAVESAIEKLTRIRLVELPAANQEIYELLKNGVKVKVPREDGRGDEIETVHVIEWKHPKENDFLLVSQMWITNDIYTKRPDLTSRASLQTMLLGICEKRNLLDIVENFTLFSTETGDLKKIIAKNHQFLGVNKAIKNLDNRQENQRKLGVFWHTQGSGKSYSMVFFTQKVLRTMGGDWTFVIVTDRKELDKQIYHTFKHTGAVTEDEVSYYSPSLL
jgi:type I site-specific restriction-modification system R (restriction) subunit